MNDPSEADRKLIANERTKLTATFANGISIAVFAVGGFAPFISTAMSAERHFGPVLILMAICWTMAAGIHWSARQSLQDLRS